MLAKMRVKHDGDCCAIEDVKAGDCKTPWFLDGRKQFYGDRRGGETGGHTRWFVVECNDLACPAEFIVMGDALEIAAMGFLPKQA